MIQERHHRLPDEIYRGIQTVAFTLCIKGRSEYFTSSEQCIVFVDILLGSAKKFNCEIVVYLFMPDHCHFILEGIDENANALSAIKAFKQKSGYWLSQHEPEVKWQKDFYDHIIRKEENLRKQFDYILTNPVRKGLVNNWKDYPLKGSTIHDFNQWD